jgi:SAM-dependent methyltransferase
VAKSKQKRDAVWNIKALRRRTESFWNLDYLERIVLPLLDIPDSAQVLDVGSGYGGLTLLLAKLLPTAQVTGIDLESKLTAGATQMAGEMGLTNVRFEEGDAHQLPHKNDTFDAVICQTVLTHVTDPAAVVQEMARVLKLGGAFMAVEGHTTGASSAFTSSDPPRDEVWHLEFFRLVRLSIAGRKALGRGDNTVGVRIPFLMTQAGLQVVDVRMQDRVFHAIPPYAKLNEQLQLEHMRNWLNNPPDDTRRQRVAETLIAGGATQADVDRYFEVTENSAEDEALHEAIEQETLIYVRPINVFVIIGRK